MAHYSIYKYKWYPVLLAGLLSLFFASCGEGGSKDGNDFVYRIDPMRPDRPVDELLSEDPMNVDYNRIWFSTYNSQGRLEELKSYGLRLFETASEQQIDELVGISAVYLSWVYLVTGNMDSVDLYRPIVERLCNTDTLTAIGLMANNVAAIRAINSELDYSTALRHFHKGLQIARNQNDTLNMAIFLSNISNIYSIRQDAYGISAAEEAFRLCRHSDNPHILVNGALTLSELLLLNNRNREAVEHASQALTLAKESNLKQHIGRCYLVFACAAFSSGDIRNASENFDAARRFIGDSDVDVQIRYYTEYGNFLLSTDRLSEAIDCLNGVLALKACTPEHKMKVYPLLSQAYAFSGMDRKALDFYKLYHRLSDSLSFSRRERDFNHLRMQYERSQYEQHIVENELTIEKKEKTIILIVLLSVLLTLVAVGIIVMQIRRERMYRKLVDQHQQHMLIARKMKESRGSGEEPDNEARRERELYEKIEALMNEDRIYRSKDLTVDKICEILHSNRSYVSKVINSYSGMSFFNYVNYKRIEEATEILSDTSNDMPLKMLSDHVGYNAISTFYRAFQKETGCSPSKYREEIRKKHKNDFSD